MDMEFGGDVDFMSDHDRSTGLSVLRNISAVLSADQSACPASSGDHHPAEPSDFGTGCGGDVSYGASQRRRMDRGGDDIHSRSDRIDVRRHLTHYLSTL